MFTCRIAAPEGRCLVLPRSPPTALRLLGADGADQPALCGGVGALRPEAEIEVVPFGAGERKDEGDGRAAEALR